MARSTSTSTGTVAAAMKATWLATQVTGRLSARLAEPSAMRLWFTPWPAPSTDRARQREAAWLAGTDALDVAWRGGTLHGFIAGSGPTVLLAHGWGDHAARLGAFVEPLTGAGLRVAAVDLPAHGSTPGTTTDIYAMADALRAVADEVDATAIVAHSLSSLVTVRAIRQGLHVDAVALIAPAVRLEPALDVFQAGFRLPSRAIAGLRRGIERRFGEGVWDELRADEAARALRVPALIVHDREDPRVAIEDVLRLRDAWPGATVEITKGLGHDRILRDPSVADHVTRFLRGRLVARAA